MWALLGEIEMICFCGIPNRPACPYHTNIGPGDNNYGREKKPWDNQAVTHSVQEQLTQTQALLGEAVTHLNVIYNGGCTGGKAATFLSRPEIKEILK